MNLSDGSLKCAEMVTSCRYRKNVPVGTNKFGMVCESIRQRLLIRAIKISSPAADGVALHGKESPAFNNQFISIGDSGKYSFT